MASLRKLDRSPYWYLRYRDLDTGVWREKCTKLKHDDPRDSRKAHRLCQKHSEEEAKVGPDAEGEFGRWVPAFLAKNYDRVNSLKRYDAAWQRIAEWLRESRLRHPRQIKYVHAESFLKWRVDSGVSRNTARLELKFFAFLIKEAMRREYCDSNPLALAKVPIQPAAPKPEIDADAFRRARAAFASKPRWMRTVFEICSNLGCRFNEAHVPMSNINFDDNLITITDSKRKEGDPRRNYTIPMRDSLVAYLRSLPQQGTTTPKLSGEMNRQFNIVLKKATGATSHSLRVSFVTRCHRAGLSESEAMRLVNHSSQLVHKIYSRLNVEDARKAMNRVEPPPPPDDL